MMQETKHVDNLELLKLYPKEEDIEMVKESDTSDIADKKTREWLRSEILLLKEERDEAEEADDSAKIDQVNEKLDRLEDEWKQISRTSVESKKVTKSKNSPTTCSDNAIALNSQF